MVELIAKLIAHIAGYALIFYGASMIHPGLVFIFMGMFIFATTKE